MLSVTTSAVTRTITLVNETQALKPTLLAPPVGAGVYHTHQRPPPVYLPRFLSCEWRSVDCFHPSVLGPL